PKQEYSAQLNQAYQGAKLIEEQILETIPEFKATDADEASQRR
ncbi:unnamed protein product, partial [Didymodactylos carnosus]